jgi:thiol reductant ABC exporter CydD subunit/thiol reductant ABC exporter CydC subunit
MLQRATASRARPGRGPLGPLPALSRTARRALAVLAALALISACLLVAQGFLLADVLAKIVQGEAVAARQWWLLIGVTAGRAVVAWAHRTVAARAAAGTKQQLREAVVRRAVELGPEWIAGRGTGQLAVVAARGLDALDKYFTEYLPALVTAAVVPVVVGGAVLLADWPSAVILILTVPLLPLFGALVGMHTADRTKASMDATERQSGQLRELIRALPVLTAFGQAGAQRTAVGRLGERHRRASMTTLRLAFSSSFVLELAAMLSVALIAVTIGVRLVGGSMDLAVGLAVLIVAPECYQPLRAVGAAFHASADGTEAVRRVVDVLAQQPAMAGRRAHTPVADPGAVIEVRGLRVRRRGGFRPDGASFLALPGQITWLTEPSGGGKSTTFAVLLGFVPPSAGSVTVDGRPLRELDPAHWRRMVAWVPQFPVFTEETVRAELATAAEDLDRQPSADDVEHMATALGCLDLLDRDPGTLSLGQRQRVAVARALLRVRCGARVLLLDEPTAHLDEANAARVMARIRAAAEDGATVLIAAHEAARDDSRAPARTTVPGRRDELEDAAPHSGRLLPWRDILHRKLLTGTMFGALALLSAIALTAVSAWLIAKAAQQPPILTLTVAIVGVRTFGLARAALRYVERLAVHDAAFQVANRLRQRLWAALVRIGPARAAQLRSAGSGEGAVVDDVDHVRDLLPRVVTPPAVVATVIATAVVVEAFMLPEAGAVLAVLATAGAVLAVLAQWYADRRATMLQSDTQRDVHRRVLALLEGAAELMAFGRLRRHQAALTAADHRLTRLARRAALADGLASAVITAASGLASVWATWLAADAVAAGQLDPLLAVPIALVPLTLAEALALLPPVAVHAPVLDSARRRLAELFDEQPPGSSAVRRTDDGTIELRSVTLRWPGAAEPALRDVRLRIEPGTHVAIVGPSGAGKSTLLAALAGLLPGEGGTAALPGSVALAPQDPQLISASVAENLRLGDPAADEDQLVSALRTARLPELADRLDLVLGSAGAGLSGGQARRLAIARALLAALRPGGPRVVLLDEPTAHLDRPTATALFDNLRTLLAGHTVVHVTHRPEEAAHADVVLEMRDGRVGPAASPVARRSEPATA